MASIGDFCGTRPGGDRAFFLKTDVMMTADRCSDLIFSLLLYNQVLNKIKIAVRNYVTKGAYISMTNV